MDQSIVRIQMKLAEATVRQGCRKMVVWSSLIIAIPTVTVLTSSGEVRIDTKGQTNSSLRMVIMIGNMGIGLPLGNW